ncbi:MAG TPA: hypothetical protein VJH67_00130 [Candidatus Paceibacterota bacterium]
MGYILGVFASTPLILAGLKKPASANFVLIVLAILLAWFVAFVLKTTRDGKPNVVRQMFITWSVCAGLSIIAWPIVDYFRMRGM